MAQSKRKKKFFNIEVPTINKEISLLAYEPKDLEGRIIKYDLSRILRGKNMIIKLKVAADGDNLSATPVETKILPSFLKRMVRKGTSNVEDSFSAECKDAILRIKPVLVSRRKISRAVRKALREKAREELTNYVKDKTYEEIFNELMSNNIQKPLSLTLKKIYPLSLCEIRILKVEKIKE